MLIDGYDTARKQGSNLRFYRTNPFASNWNKYFKIWDTFDL